MIENNSKQFANSEQNHEHNEDVLTFQLENTAMLLFFVAVALH